jgi:gamma-glutamyltranspeptidase / glutathione hydrolase
MKVLWWRVACCVLLLGLIPAVYGASRSPVRGSHAMVVCVERRAAQVGLDILKRGGNAVDAAVAVGFALAVTHPSAGNLGGGGFMMIREVAAGTVISLDYRETAPSAAARDMYVDPSGTRLSETSTVGWRASGVPGTVAGLAFALEKHGTMKLADVLAPAVALARDGVELSWAESESLRESRKLLNRFPESRRVYLRDGNLYAAGEIFRQPDLARSLRLIAQNGPGEFYRGSLACRIAEDMKLNGGLITLDDLRNYRPLERKPVEESYRGYRVYSMPPPSSGGIALLEMLNIVEAFPLERYGAGSSRSLHLLAESMKLAFADRAEFLGDSDFVRIPVAGLISKRYAAERRSLIDPFIASDPARLVHGAPAGYESEQTTHFSIVDDRGNAVANTYTLNSSFGSGVTVRGTGILMNDEMDDFSAKPGLPNTEGLIYGEANAIVPGKRPLSSMTPTIVTRDGELYMVLGSPGGPTIINTVFQVLTNVIDFGMTIQEAVDAPRIHHQWMPAALALERAGFPDDVKQALQSRGHTLRIRGSIGDCQAILVDSKTRVRLGAADPRMDGVALGY